MSRHPNYLIRIYVFIYDFIVVYHNLYPNLDSYNLINCGIIYMNISYPQRIK
jgi:hypothetical protein